MLEIYTYETHTPGPRFLFLGSVHGDEPCGSLAIDTICEKINTEKIKILKGSITFIPRVNTQAYISKVRFIDVNLNRVVKKTKNPTTYEDTLAQELLSEIEKVDYVVDLHSMTAKTVPIVFVDYITQRNIELAKATGLSDFVYGWSELYVETEQNADTISYTNSIGLAGITIECGQHSDPESFNVAYNSIINILSTYGLIKNSPLHTSHIEISAYVMQKIYFKDHNKDTLMKNYKNFDVIKYGDVIATRENGEKIISEIEGHIMLPNDSVEKGQEWFYFGCKK